MSTFFSNCNYSPNTIQSAINRISKISQTEALQPRPKQSTTERIPLVLTYTCIEKNSFSSEISRKSYNMKNPTPNTYLLHPLYWPTDVTPTSNNYSSEAPLIRNQMAHTPLDTHYAAPVNTPILPMPYLVPRTLSMFNITCSSVSVIYSITCTKCSILYIGETCCQLNTRYGEHLRSAEEKKHLSPEYQDDDDINVAIHFNLPNHSINDMGISVLL